MKTNQAARPNPSLSGIYANSTNPDQTPCSVASDLGLLCLLMIVLRFYGPVDPNGLCQARSVYLTTRLLGRLSPQSG